jgi:putative spermidine/putrescine transport system permease protein
MSRALCLRVSLLWGWCVLVLVFLMVPLLVPVPLSFNSGSFFTFPLAGLSTRWYGVVLGTGRWRAAIGNSPILGFGTTVLATALGTLAAIGLSSPHFPGRRMAMPLLISPLVVPIVVTAVAGPDRAILHHDEIGHDLMLHSGSISKKAVRSPLSANGT